MKQAQAMTQELDDIASFLNTAAVNFDGLPSAYDYKGWQPFIIPLVPDSLFKNNESVPLLNAQNRLPRALTIAGNGKIDILIPTPDDRPFLLLDCKFAVDRGEDQSRFELTNIQTGAALDAGDTITPAQGMNNIKNGRRIKFITAPAGLSVNIFYYVISAGATTFQVSLTSGGAAEVITANGSCTFIMAGDISLALNGIGNALVPTWRQVHAAIVITNTGKNLYGGMAMTSGLIPDTVNPYDPSTGPKDILIPISNLQGMWEGKGTLRTPYLVSASGSIKVEIWNRNSTTRFVNGAIFGYKMLASVK